MLKYLVVFVLAVISVFVFTSIYSRFSFHAPDVSRDCSISNNSLITFGQFLDVINSNGCGGRVYESDFSASPDMFKVPYVLSSSCSPKQEYMGSRIVVLGGGMKAIYPGNKIKILEYGDALIICPIKK